MKKAMKRKTKIGLACLAVSLIITRLSPMLAFISGALSGCALFLILLGAVPEKVEITLKNWKNRLFRHADK